MLECAFLARGSHQLGNKREETEKFVFQKGNGISISIFVEVDSSRRERLCHDVEFDMHARTHRLLETQCRREGGIKDWRWLKSSHPLRVGTPLDGWCFAFTFTTLSACLSRASASCQRCERDWTPALSVFDGTGQIKHKKHGRTRWVWDRKSKSWITPRNLAGQSSLKTHG